MNSQTEETNSLSPLAPALRSLWITLDAQEVIELKRITMDHDETGAVAFFRDVLVPRVCSAARQRGIALDKLVEAQDDEHIPG